MDSGRNQVWPLAVRTLVAAVDRGELVARRKAPVDSIIPGQWR